MRPLRVAVVDLLRDPADQVLAASILGTTDPDAIVARVEGFAADAVARRVVGCLLFTQSVGAVFGLALDDARRVALKVHASSDGRRGPDAVALAAVYRVQAELAASGIPCAPVLAPPRPWDDAGRVAAVMGWLPGAAGDDPHAPAVGRAMAHAMAGIVERCRAVDASGLPTSALPPDLLFPPAHNALFDLTAPGGEWIDARARAAREVLDRIAERRVAMHTDVSGANVLVSGGVVRAIYDMDSVAWIDEMRALASAAVHFTYRGDGTWTWPSRAEARGFVRAYADARGAPLGDDERAKLDAAAIYAMAYTARCEHSVRGGVAGMDVVLRDAPAAYLSEG
jgi:aminoglycoside phosphotransferase (APT) family kinase protein